MEKNLKRICQEIKKNVSAACREVSRRHRRKGKGQSDELGEDSKRKGKKTGGCCKVPKTVRGDNSGRVASMGLKK